MDNEVNDREVVDQAKTANIFHWRDNKICSALREMYSCKWKLFQKEKNSTETCFHNYFAPFEYLISFPSYELLYITLQPTFVYNYFIHKGEY